MKAINIILLLMRPGYLGIRGPVTSVDGAWRLPPCGSNRSLKKKPTFGKMGHQCNIFSQRETFFCLGFLENFNFIFVIPSPQSISVRAFC